MMFLVLCCIVLVLRFSCRAQDKITDERYDLNKSVRHILEENYKPALFGSHKFNPVLLKFEDTNTYEDETQKPTEVGLNVTEIGKFIFRQHAYKDTLTSAMWWSTSRARNNVTKTIPKSRTTLVKKKLNGIL